MKWLLTLRLDEGERVVSLLRWLKVSRKDDANRECSHGQHPLLCFRCNPKETMPAPLNQISAS